jgi:type IV pilus assembly protein PilM
MIALGEKNLIGIDIGSYAIKVVKLKGRPGAYTLEAAVDTKLPREGEGGLPVSSHLENLLKAGKVKGREAAAAITGPSLIFRYLTLPQMPEKDLDEAVRWEIRKEIAIPASELVTDFVVSGHGGAPEGGKQSVIAFAARKGDANGIIKIFREAGLELKVINVIPTALLAVFNENNDWDAGSNYAMLEMGETSSMLAILKDRRLAFTREITFGGKDLTRSVAGALNLTEPEAEEYKETHGLNIPSGDAPKLRDSLNPIIERLCSEIHRSIDYYQAQFRGGALGQVFLSGGTACLKGIDDYISETLGLACFVHDPFKKIQIPSRIDQKRLRAVSPSLNVATGLAVKVK